MNTTPQGRLLMASVLLAGALLGGAAAGEDEGHWALAFENDTPKLLWMEPPGYPITYYWYVVYRVKNPTDQPRPARLTLTLHLALAGEQTVYRDVLAPLAESRLERKVVERPLCNWVELRAEKLKAGQEREAVAIFRVGEKAPDFDKMTIRVEGLVAHRELEPPDPDSETRKVLHRVLLIHYDYVPSRWTRGKELKYDRERWRLEESQAPSGGPAGGEEGVSEKLDKLRQKMKEETERTPVKKGPAPESSAAPPPPREPAARPNPRLVQALRSRADATQSVRAAYSQLTGLPDRREAAGGTAFLGPGGKFYIERVVGVETRRGRKEIRIFDGEHLWVHTHGKELGDFVGRWTAAATKAEWRRLGGGGHAAFATVINPFRAWRLFRADLLHVGTEQLEVGPAEVFEVRPGERYRQVLKGPLSGELLASTLGKRVRFWVGRETGFQYRMRVYDQTDRLCASVECLDVEFDAHTDPARFAFSPPAGAEVVDLNAAFAGNDGPGEDSPAP
ncbi:MAG: LolA family protein [Candidatus Brocadiia bacterium]